MAFSFISIKKLTGQAALAMLPSNYLRWAQYFLKVPRYLV